MIGVRGDAQGHRHRQRSCSTRSADWARRHGIRDLRTQAAWNDHGDAALARRDGLRAGAEPHRRLRSRRRPVHARARRSRDDPARRRAGAARSTTAPSRATTSSASRATCADVRAMGPGDLADIVRIDRAITGRDRAGYMQAKLDEAMNDSAIRVSLTARLDDVIVGFLMARADLGDFGRTEPVAVIDTIGVDPGLRASRRRPRAAVAALRQSGRAAHRARRNDRRAARPRAARLPLRRRIRAVAAAAVRAAPRLTFASSR